MNMKSNFLVSGTLALLICSVAMADGYTPDVVEFDGTTALAFDAAPQLVLADGGTVEFWVVPDWTSDPGYDPAILSNMGPEGYSYLVAMLRDRSGLAFAAGESEDVVSFDFADGRLHHVAISQFDDGVSIYVDGQVVGGSAIRSLDLPSDGVWVGSIDGANNLFRGAIAGLRFWDTVLTQEEIVKFALTDVFDGDHPNIDNLSAMSNFNSGELLLVQPENEQ